MEKRLTRWLVLACLATAVLGVLGGAACASTSHSPAAAAQEAAVVVLSLQKITCRSCGAQCIDALEKRDGVVDVRFDEKAAELSVRYEPGRLDEDAIVAAVRDLGYEVEVGGGKGSFAEQIEWPAAADVVVIAPAGESVTLEEHLAPGKVTVVDFYADWCGPCRLVDRQLLSYVEIRDDVAVRKVNVVDWSSPVAKAFLQDVPQLPYVIVFGKDGQRVDAIAGLDLPRLDRAVATGGAR